jgi:hypothetical protein
MPVKTIKMSMFNDAIWNCLRPYLPPSTSLSCVYRTDQDQLDITVERATKIGYKFPKPPTVSDPGSWLQAWHLINTKRNPVARPGFSQHRLGRAYDLTGPDLSKIIDGIKKAASVRAINLAPPRRNFENPKLEGVCVHVEIIGGRMDTEPFDFV